MNSDIFFHILPRLSKNTLLNLYFQDKNILTETNKTTLINLYKKKLNSKSSSKILSFLCFLEKSNFPKQIDECLNELHEYKKINLNFYWIANNNKKINLLEHLNNIKIRKEDNRRFDFVFYNVKKLNSIF